MKKVILGVDGSESADKAMDRIIAEAKCCKMEVIVVSVAEVLSTLSLKKDYSQAYERLMEEPRKILDEALERLKEEKVEARGVIEAGRPATVIAELARKEKADEVVVGSLGKHAVDRLLLGGVSARLIEIAPCTVVIVR